MALLVISVWNQMILIWRISSSVTANELIQCNPLLPFGLLLKFIRKQNVFCRLQEDPKRTIEKKSLNLEQDVL